MHSNHAWFIPRKIVLFPVSPVLNLLSVQPETGYVELSWSLSPSTDIAAYIVYNHNSGYWITIDTIWDPTATSYLYKSNGTKYFSESYVVAAFRKPVCTSPLSNILSTIFCTASIDTCKKQITVRWNKYSNNPSRVIDYRILLSKNGAPLTATYTADSTANNFIITDFEANTNYYFAVMAELEGGNNFEFQEKRHSEYKDATSSSMDQCRLCHCN